MNVMSNGSTGRIIAMALALVLTLLAHPAAMAKGDHIEVSLDGLSWSSSHPHPLLGGAIVLVPRP